MLRKAISSLRIANGVGVDETTDLKRRCRGDQGVAHLARLVLVACRSKAGGKESQISGVLCVFLARDSSPPGRFVIFTCDVVGQGQAGMGQADVGVGSRQAPRLADATARPPASGGVGWSQASP